MQNSISGAGVLAAILLLSGCGFGDGLRPEPVTAASEATLNLTVKRANGRPFPTGTLVVSLVDPAGGPALAEATAPVDGTSVEVPFQMTVAAGPLAAAGAEPRFAVRDATSGKAYPVDRREQFYEGGAPTVALTVKG